MKWEPKYTIILIAILAATGIVSVSILRDRIVNQQFRNVTALGQGKVSYTPDTATVLMGVQVDRTPKPEEALNNLNNKMAAVKKAVLALGIKEEDLNTANYSLSPQYDYKDGVQTAAGYSANQQLSVKVRDMNNNKDLVNKVVAAAGSAGANQINGISFSAANLEDLKQQARVKAIEDARTKAVGLAQAAGVRLDKITNWYENYQPIPYDSVADGKGGMGGGAVAPGSISVGSNEVVMEVTLTYSLK